MLELNVEIRGEPALVRPAEDTIEKGNLYFLSNIDNFPLKITTVYCYQPTENEGNIEEEKLVEVLKSSLSKVLVHYYPLAGRLTTDLEGRLVVDCTDEGAVFVEAKAHCTIQEIGDDTVAMAELVPPFLDRSILRARNPPKIEFPHHEYASIEDVSNTDDLYNENVFYKSFCFEYEKIQKLKMAAKEDGVVDKCSTFEVVSAFIWKSRTQALKLRYDQSVKYVLVVDGRLRFDPPLPENYFGDLIEKPLSFAVGLIREAIQTVTDRYMRSVIDYVEVKQPHLTMTSTLLITTWTRLSLDTMDFGWGKPFLVGPAYVPGRELAIFCPNPKEKNVIDVLLSFPASSMKIFEELMNI
ncbi:hypothetical protein RHMOL_Rhmol09G0039700 [Rhododendron molle]|uniref:Uncharacterized protein n=1 Tax=Rhododendron molle TaxID=49168 RepID=A0ACC0M9L4_RHOML|nr:hypothetical protein RHMOL_Rhmol09G0039700 [Rhododendron molle]